MAALVFCTPANVAASVINGREVVRDGALLTADLPNVLLRHRALARTLFERASQALMQGRGGVGTYVSAPQRISQSIKRTKQKAGSIAASGLSVFGGGA